MSRTSEETADHLNNHLMAPLEDKKTEADEIDRAAQNTLNEGQEGARERRDRLRIQSKDVAL